MATTTPNYGFTKPDPTENAAVNVININTDSIDTVLRARVDEANLARNKERGLNRSLTDTNSKVVSAGAWTTLYELSELDNTTLTTHWLLDLRFEGRKTTATLPTSLSLRIDRGVNRGGTVIIMGGAASSHVMTTEEKAVTSAITTFTGLHAPDEIGQAGYWYDIRIVGAGETSNSDKFKVEVSPVGANASFDKIIAQLTMRS